MLHMLGFQSRVFGEARNMTCISTNYSVLATTCHFAMVMRQPVSDYCVSDINPPHWRRIRLRNVLISGVNLVVTKVYLCIGIYFLQRGCFFLAFSCSFLQRQFLLTVAYPRLRNSYLVMHGP